MRMEADRGAAGSPLNLIDRPPAETLARLRAMGLTARAARFAFTEKVLRGAASLERAPDLSRAERTALNDRVAVPRLEIADRRVDLADGFTKYLFRLPDGLLVEAVRIPLKKPTGLGEPRFTVCLSTEAGCAMGCTFCATGRLGLLRRLEPWEIVAQAIAIRDEAPGRVAGAVLMGQGEPLDNIDATWAACDILGCPEGVGIPRKAITISTVGMVPGIRRFAEDRRRERLAFSLVTAVERKRREMVPLARRWSLAEVRSALDEVVAATRRRVLIVFLLAGGRTTTEEDGEAAVEFLEGLPCWLDLIDINDPSGALHPPDPDERDRFFDALRRLHQPIQVRYSGGQSILAACGTLASTRQGGAPAPILDLGRGAPVVPHSGIGAGPVKL